MNEWHVYKSPSDGYFEISDGSTRHLLLQRQIEDLVSSGLQQLAAVSEFWVIVLERQQELGYLRQRVIDGDARIADINVRLKAEREKNAVITAQLNERIAKMPPQPIRIYGDSFPPPRSEVAVKPPPHPLALQQQLIEVFERYTRNLEDQQTMADRFDETVRQLIQEIGVLNERNSTLSDTWQSHKEALDAQAARIQEQDQQIRRQQDEIDGLMALRKNEAEISRRSAELHIGRTRRCSDCGGIHTEHTLMCPLLLEAMQKSSGMTATEALKYPGLQSDAVLDTARPTYQPGDQMTATDVMKAQIAEEHAKPSKTFERVRPEQCDHEWIGHQNPNTPDGPGESVYYCDKCGDEKGGD